MNCTLKYEVIRKFAKRLARGWVKSLLALAEEFCFSLPGSSFFSLFFEFLNFELLPGSS